AKSLGSDTIILEKGAYIGGTTLVSGGGAFIANSKQMQAMGYDDPREERLKYMARYSWPHLYQPDHETLGLPQHDFDMISAYYDIGSVAIDYLESVGAAKYGVQMIGGSVPPVPNVDYMDHFEEDIPKEAGTLATYDADGNLAGGGNMIGVYKAWADANGMEVRLGHRVVRVVLGDDGAVIGVEVEIADPTAAATPSATPAAAAVKTIKAKKGVIVGSGGLVRIESMMKHRMPAPHFMGCGAPTNEGDFQRIAMALGAQQGNLHNVYRNEGVYEQGIADPSAYNCIWFHHGDSMLIVNGTGKRFHNERRNYQDRPMAHFDWDPNNGTWGNLLGYVIYDQRVAENWGGALPYP
ncbi:MAG: FAD-binding protein, partial [Thermomicrobiales bacterium]